MFLSVDTDDIGVVSFKEALLILQNFRLNLTKDEIQEFKPRLDVDNTGMVEYKHFTDIGSWIVFGNFLKA